ncbi:class I SAM-dependent methyltransferase [Pannonibacter phragmitetus]|uniref:class I SAM-dependent methyltransferase n=1 Tax=Pannonibacter phragmitetus TaxID=121719 RepID=UPI003D2EBF73
MSPRELILETIPRCPVCACPQAQHLDAVSDTLIPEINRYLPATEQPLQPVTNTRVKCSNCDLVYLSPRLDADSLRELYRLWYGYAYRSIFSDPRHQRDRDQEFREYHLSYLQRHAPQGGRLLDIGSGSGMFLGIAKDHGWDGTGIELDQGTAEWASAKYGVNVRFGTVQSALEDNERFDAITMFDYLEHTDRPGLDLAAAADHLKSGGLLVIRVPNQAGWQSRFMKQNWIAVISNHLTYFTPDSLARALEQNGFDVLECTAHNYRGQADILRQRWQWLRGKLGEAPSGAVQQTTQPGDAKRGALGQIGRLAHSLLIEQIDHIGGWFGKSNFLMVVARKQ